MIRMSDIIKMSDEGMAGREAFLTESRREGIERLAQDAQYNKTKAAELYEKGLVLIEDAISKVRASNMLEPGPIMEYVREMVETMTISENEQFSYFYKATSPRAYLPNHSLNVGLLATQMGIWEGLNRSELVELASAGLLHDMGMVKVEEIAQKEGTLGDEERHRIGEHPKYSEAILRKSDCFTSEAISAVRAHHDRGCHNRFSQVLGLADIYEAMTHPRIYRRAKPPHQAMEEIIAKEAAGFHSDVVKTLVNNIGIYPVGSWVKLNTGEIGMVISSNKNYPLRPKLNLLFASSGEKLKEIKFLDLLEESHLYIDSPVDISLDKKEATG